MELNQINIVLEKSLTQNLDWIKAAESKLALIIPLSTGMISVLVILLPTSLSHNWCYIGAFMLSLVLLTGSLICSGFATFPRTKGPKSSLIYFGGIASHSKDEFTKQTKQLTPELYNEDLSWQVYINAKIATIKYSWIQKSMIFLFSAMIPWLLSIYFYYRG